MSEKIEIDAIDEDSDLWLVNEQIKGLLEGIGASEDHESVRAFFLATGLPAGTVDRIHRAITHGDAKAGWPVLQKPAQVGNGIFGKGVSSRFVVESAQRIYEIHQSPEKLAERAAAIQQTGLVVALRDQQIEALKQQMKELLAEVVKAREEMAGGNFNSSGERIDHAIASAKGCAA